MAMVFHGLKATPFHLLKKGATTGKAFDIANLAFHDAALSGLAGCEDLSEPSFRGEMIGQSGHAASLPQDG
jgi:hypothetical protein